jgi:hypothetical protein
MTEVKLRELTVLECKQMKDYTQEIFLPRYFKGEENNISYIKEINYLTMYFNYKNERHYLEFHTKETATAYSAYFSELNTFPQIEIRNKESLEELFLGINREMKKYHLSQIYGQ